tara:strand:- start:273 stop:701 length:429 start_codon:yes stop_codon:yes gene_type:complete
MKPSYTFIDHTADVLFQAQAPSLPELFAQCGLALEETQVDINLIKQKEKTHITGKNKKIELLLFDFLDDLLFYKDSELLIYSKFEVKIKKEGDIYHLDCLAHGEKLSHQKHDPKVDVKAITMHLFGVKKIEGGYQAQVLVDI